MEYFISSLDLTGVFKAFLFVPRCMFDFSDLRRHETLGVSEVAVNVVGVSPKPGRLLRSRFAFHVIYITIEQLMSRLSAFLPTKIPTYVFTRTLSFLMFALFLRKVVICHLLLIDTQTTLHRPLGHSSRSTVFSQNT